MAVNVHSSTGYSAIFCTKHCPQPLTCWMIHDKNVTLLPSGKVDRHGVAQWLHGLDAGNQSSSDNFPSWLLKQTQPAKSHCTGRHVQLPRPLITGRNAVFGSFSFLWTQLFIIFFGSVLWVRCLPSSLITEANNHNQADLVALP